MISAILIDDNQNSIDALQLKLAKHCPEVKILQTCTDPEEALQAIAFHKPDTIFLDVEMPEMNGFTLLQQIPVIDFEIIFVTAYNHYAIPAIKVNAFDYLEKPVNIKLLKETVTRLTKRIDLRLQKTTAGSSRAEIQVKELFDSIQQFKKKPAGLALPSSEGIEMVELNEIVWLESVNNYTRFYLNNGKKILVSKTIGEYEDRLTQYDFIRIHRSYIINLHHLHKYHREDGGSVEMKNGTRLEVSVRKKQELLEKLKQLS